MESASITTSTELDQAIEDPGLAAESAMDDTVQKPNEAESSQTCGTASLPADENPGPNEQCPNHSTDSFECTAVECTCEKFGRIEDLFANGTSMASATNDTSPWIFFFFQRFDGWVQLSLVPKDYRSRIITLETIAEAVEQSPLSCILDTHRPGGSVLTLFFVQLLEDGKQHLAVRQLDLNYGPPFEWDGGELQHDDSIPVPANIVQIESCLGELGLVCVSPNRELFILDDTHGPNRLGNTHPTISIPAGGTLFFDSVPEDTGYWQLPLFGGPAIRTIVLVYAVCQGMMTRYEIRHWYDDRSSESRIEECQIQLNWHGLAISSSPGSYLPLYEEKYRDMIGFYCKTYDDKVFYFNGHYEDELEQPELVCSVKAGSQIHLLAGCRDLLYVSAENELRISRRIMETTGTVRHEVSRLHRPSNYFVTALEKLVVGPLDGYIPPHKVCSEGQDPIKD